jgi:FlaA1/EpsC-like NDP-sugar epimerase
VKQQTVTLCIGGAVANLRNVIIFIIDTILIALAFVLSSLIRFDFHLPPDLREIFYQGLCVAVLVKTAVFLVTGFYRKIWRYTSLQDLLYIFSAVTVASVFSSCAIMFFRHFDSFPRSILVLDWFLLVFLTSASRVSWRCFREMRHDVSTRTGPRTLIVGAGEAGSLLLKEIRKQSGSSYNVVGFADDDETKQGKFLSGVRVLGRLAELAEIVRRHGIQEVIMAIPSARGNVLRRVLDESKKAGVRCRTLPSISDIIDCKITISQIRDVEIADLLGREPVVVDEAGIRSCLTGKKVLVSGAAGSIGSEICRQAARFRPEILVLLDNAETPLFFIDRELSEKNPDLRIVPVIGDVKSREKIDLIFDEYLPDVVFHAAAYKHVPMMEYNPVEAVANNVGGTMVLANAAHRYGVRDFVLISTDKAVNPTNVMGATKRVAEIYVQALDGKSETNFTAVRFGNVLGSNGSVIPLFMEQIKKGGPVTVTHPEVIRYFMTIPEAAQLVLQAGCLGTGGEIFVLDMGEPVRIVELAEELIRLSGLVPYEDVDIVFTGLRPGEKLFEELLVDGEGITRTSHEKIRVIAALEANHESVTNEIYRMLKLANDHSVGGVMNSLCGLVPEFTPGSVFDDLHARDCRIRIHVKMECLATSTEMVSIGSPTSI